MNCVGTWPGLDILLRERRHQIVQALPARRPVGPLHRDCARTHQDGEVIAIGCDCAALTGVCDFSGMERETADVPEPADILVFVGCSNRAGSVLNYGCLLSSDPVRVPGTRLRSVTADQKALLDRGMFPATLLQGEMRDRGGARSFWNALSRGAARCSTAHFSDSQGSAFSANISWLPLVRR